MKDYLKLSDVCAGVLSGGILHTPFAIRQCSFRVGSDAGEQTQQLHLSLDEHSSHFAWVNSFQAKVNCRTSVEFGSFIKPLKVRKGAVRLAKLGQR